MDGTTRWSRLFFHRKIRAVAILLFLVSLPIAMSASLLRLSLTRGGPGADFIITDARQGVRQRSLLDCGPIALVMLMNQFGENPNVDKLERELPRSYAGTSIYALEKAANKRQFKSQVHRGIAGTMPFILLHNHHFYVVLKRKGSRFDVLDPAVGRGLLTDQTTKSEYSLHISRG